MTDATPTRSAANRPVRLVIFGDSIISDWNNPAATTWRELMLGLRASGHETTFLEPRGSIALTNLLRKRGAAGLRSFGAAFPTLSYRTVEPPLTRDVDVWLTREVATADGVIGVDTLEPRLLERLALFRHERLVRVLHRTTGAHHPLAEAFDLVAAPYVGDEPGMFGALGLGPAFAAREQPLQVTRSGTVIVAYDDVDAELLADVKAQIGLASDHPEAIQRLSAGSLARPGWRPVVESDLFEVYGRAERAVIALGSQSPPIVASRALLPVSVGCPVVVIGNPDDWPTLTVAGIPVLSPTALTDDGLRRLTSPVAPPPWLTAEIQAATLATTIARTLQSRRQSG